MPAARSVLSLLRQNFVREVPGEQQGVVRHRLQQLLRRIDRQMDAGYVSTLFVVASIDNEIQHFLTNAAVIQERAALSGCAVGGQMGPLPLQIREKTAQRFLDLLHTIRETTLKASFIDGPAGFLFEPSHHAGRGINGAAVFNEQPN